LGRLRASQPRRLALDPRRHRRLVCVRPRVPRRDGRPVLRRTVSLLMDVRQADAGFRRLAVGVLVAGVCAGAVLIQLVERYRGALAEWVRADAGQSAQRVELILATFAVLLVAPLVAMAAYLSLLGRRTARTGEYPPPGFRVIRDTPIVRGHEALSR